MKKINYAWFIFIGCCCLMAGGMSCCLVTAGLFFPSVCQDIGCSYGELSIYLSCYSLGMVVVAPLVGYLLPRANIRILMSAMCVCVVLAEGLMSTYTEVWQWYVSGTVFGLCGTFLFLIPAPLLIGNWFKKRTGFILGITMSFSGLGAIIWSQLFTYFISTLGWRTAYICVAAIMAILILPWTLFVFRFRPSDMGLLPYGEHDTKEHEKEMTAEQKDPNKIPGLPTKAALLSIPFVCIVILSGCEEYYGGINTNMPSFIASIGMSASFGATIVSVTQAGNIVIKLGVGWLADKIGIVKTTYIQMAICALACLVLATSRNETPLLIASFLLGVQNSVVTVSEPMLVRHYFGERSYAQIYSAVRVGAGILSALLMPVAGYIYDGTGSYEWAFILGVLISVMNAILVMIGRKFMYKRKHVEV